MKNLITLMLLGALACGGSTQNTETTPEPEPEPEPAPVAQVEPVTAVAVDPPDVHIEGDHITIDGHINFETDSDVILADSNELLDHIAQLISNHTGEIAHLKVIGHTDAAGGHDHNQELSERRAAAVVDALRTRGVSIELEASGVGELEPVCEEDTDECHARNRRVEFLIVQDEPAAEPAPTDA
ncbi:MAG TPA: OmpA family protein [Polyangiaceae bacterium LLY-WYZ-15_(1-7)]|nr:flagellar motor protein MotB [Myxococcales bacterium]MAT26955.1 flagellar motor protein MotB [Sandaracinus sp.]HJK93797.1 OmpA family protein [Polyangiaceae bacterium LLY-WYZ-15_(1-7)]HJL03691.1 OmpA family protein [Polyangiaceae bacterium LLY-WYZ-15_(1-7)]HJL23621.1 OmpA family protein [Polyangiaceae bacterium LLY-WYZ-15_(1-7)]